MKILMYCVNMTTTVPMFYNQTTPKISTGLFLTRALNADMV